MRGKVLPSSLKLVPFADLILVFGIARAGEIRVRTVYYKRPLVPLLQLSPGGAGRYVRPMVPLQVPAQQAAHQEGGWLPPPSQAHQVKGR